VAVSQSLVAEKILFRESPTKLGEGAYLSFSFVKELKAMVKVNERKVK